MIISFLPYKFVDRFVKHEDVTVRYQAILCSDHSVYLRVIDDKDAGIRNMVAQRIDPSYLPKMAKDSDQFVKTTAIKRLQKEASNEP